MEAGREAVLKQVAESVPDPAASSVPVRMAVDGVDGAGKTVFADELARVLEGMGRAVVRVSVDAFHAVAARRYARGRLSPVGFWLDSYDYTVLTEQVLSPFAPGGDRRFRRAAHDVATDAVLDGPWERAADHCVLIVDGIFLHRDELVGAWDFSVFLHADFETTLERMVNRDGVSPDIDDPRNQRYIGGQRLYLQTCDPAMRARLVVDNSDFDNPVIMQRRGSEH